MRAHGEQIRKVLHWDVMGRNGIFYEDLQVAIMAGVDGTECAVAPRSCDNAPEGDVC